MALCRSTWSLTRLTSRLHARQPQRRVLYSVSHPSEFSHGQQAHFSVVKAPEPIVRIEHDEAAFCTLDWGNSEMIAGGLANGTLSQYFVITRRLKTISGAIVVYNIGRAVRSPSERELPTVTLHSAR